MDSIENIVNEQLKIPLKYLKNSRTDSVEGIIHHSWLSHLLSTGKVPLEFVLHDYLSPPEVEAWFKQGEDFGSQWLKVLFKVVWKQSNPVIPLPRTKTTVKPETVLSYSQIMHYVANSNHKNLWKKAFKKYSRDSSVSCGGRRDHTKVRLTNSATVIKDAISRAYGCPLIQLDGTKSALASDENNISHPNLLPCHTVLETSDYFLMVYEGAPSYSLLDCVTFSPAVLSCHGGPLFLVYQLLRLLRHFHDLGLVVGDISLSDIRVDSHLWIQVIPRLEDNLYELPTPPAEPIRASSPPSQEDHVYRLTLAWSRGALSNLDYLTELNKLSGRRYGDPRCHHVLPWVTDFSSHNGANWRDLTRSKFRLNKGDRQLDLTYDLPPSASSTQVPHHVSDVLSEITYYVYLARVTPRSLLCRYVRPQWVPAEYPSSIQRLQQWTPDECIPEFFTNPSVFKSIHPDLPDLELPAWASSAEQLIAHHRAALESNYVSDRLHHWIDLTFGYKLSGMAAVKSKNVCLQLVDGHTELADCGVVQLFFTPHPQRSMPFPYWGISPPRIHNKKTAGSEEEEDGEQSSGAEAEDSSSTRSSPLAASRQLRRSQNSLQTSGTISLPHNYNPVALLTAVEAMHTFTGPGTVHSDCEPCMDMLSQAKLLVAAARQQEMQVLGCLIAEMFLGTKLRLYKGCLQFSQRLSVCRSLVSTNKDSVPRCVRSLVTLLLQDASAESPVTSFGTPPPSAHLLLQPALSSSILPLPSYLASVYSLVSGLHAHNAAIIVLQRLQETVVDHSDQLVACIEHLNDSKVQLAARYLQQLLDQPTFTIDHVLSEVLDLLTDPPTAVSASWLLFDSIALALGPVVSRKLLLEPMVRLYDYNPTLGSQRLLKKRLKLYHRSFLLRLIIRFRLRTFLDHFVTPLVEAVGGCHDGDCILPSDSLQTTDIADGVLSPLDEDSSADSEKIPVNKPVESHILISQDDHKEPEVFVMETDDSKVLNVGVGAQMLDEEKDGDEEVLLGQPETQKVHERRLSVDKDTGKSAFEYHKVSEVSVASVQWLSHRLGPVLTATHLTRNLLRMLSLCYAGPGLTTLQTGDESAAGALQCLTSVVELYGEQFIVVQYLPTASDVIAQARRRLTSSLEGGVVGHLSLLTHMLPLISDNTLHHLFQDVILTRICGPCLRLLATTRQLFPNGVSARRAVALRLIHVLQTLMLRATTEQKIALVHTVARLFMVFSKARGQIDDCRAEDSVTKVQDFDCSESSITPQSSPVHVDSTKVKAMEELLAAMTADMAYEAYYPFSKFYGDSLMEQSLKNHPLIKKLCTEHVNKCDSHLSGRSSLVDRGDSDVEDSVGSFGTNVIVIGNRIDLQEPPTKSASPGAISGDDVTDISSKLTNNTSRHLRGNWLSYWQHELTTSTSPAHLDIKQIRLQMFTGHTNSVRALTVLDNENSFLSASRDKTVKVWSLRSMGDGSATCPPQWTFTGHRKCVLSIGFSEAARVAVSCDSSLHVWDPYVGRVLVQMDPAKSPPVNILRPLPSPSFQVLAATTDPTLRTLDTRVGGFVSELKVPSSSAGLIRCIAVAPSSNIVALGQASGHLSVMDLRTGCVLSAWRAHDAEILQLVAVNDQMIVSSSLDQSISVWNPSEGKLKFNMKGPTEPVHCLDLFGGMLVSGTTANRIGVHTTIDPAAEFSCTRLRADGFRGIITNIQVLPLNRLMLFGTDNGSINLIC